MSDIVAFKAGSTTPAEITAAFKKFDTNGDGFLSKSEIVKILTRQGGGNALDEGDAEDFAEQYITECDANGDGKISSKPRHQPCPQPCPQPCHQAARECM